jgi:heptosyltransferase III
MAAKNKQKILIYLFGSLGDTIVAIPALRTIRRHFRDAELILMENLSAEGIVRVSQVVPENLLDGHFDYEIPAGGFRKLLNIFTLNRRLRREKFDAAVYLVISERPAASVSRDRIFFRLSGVRRLIGFHAFSETQLYPRDENGRPAMTEHEAARKLHRLRMDGIEILPEDSRLPLIEFSENDLRKVQNWLASRRKKTAAKLVAVAPGCKTKANVWSLENFIEIGRRLIAENCELLIVGGKGEFDAGNQMLAAWGEGINAAGEFSIRESGALLSLCDFYIGLDTGSTHLAAAVGTRCFALYGERNNPGQWFPGGGGHYVLNHPVECAGCRHLICPLPENYCMTGMKTEQVWEKLKEFLHEEDRSERGDLKLIHL